MTLSTSIILKISLSTSGGINLAEIPESEEEALAQLSSGLTAALLSFAQEVHNQKLRNISLHNRTLTFIPVTEFVLVVETSNLTNKEKIRLLLDLVQQYAMTLLKDYDYMSLFPEKAYEILEDILSYDYVLDELGIDKPFTSADIDSFEIDNTTGDIVSGKSSDRNMMIKEFVIKGKEISIEQDTIHTFMPLGDDVTYNIIQIEDKVTKVGWMSLPKSDAGTLFRMLPIIEEATTNIMKVSPDLSQYEVLERIRDIPDLAVKTVEELDLDFLSLEFLKNNIKKKIDQVLMNVIVGKNPVIVIGTKPSVKVVTQTLLLFSQHKSIEYIDWLDPTETEIGAQITGMSIAQYQGLKDNIEKNKNIVVVNVDNKKVIKSHGGNKYIGKLFDKVKNLEIRVASKIISEELGELVNQAIKVTSLVLLSRDDSIKQLQAMKKELGDDSKFTIIMNMAKQRNVWIDSVLSDLNSALKTAESYLSSF